MYFQKLIHIFIPDTFELWDFAAIAETVIGNKKYI